MPEILWIKDWGRVFRLREAENHDQVTWTKFPVSRSSLSYRRLMSSSKGRAAYCVFIGCIRIVARGRTNGHLFANGRALNAKDLADETGISVQVCKTSIELLQSAEIGWLTDSAPVSNRSETGLPPAQEQSRAEQNTKTENKGRESVGSVPVLSLTPPACLPARTKADLLREIGVGEPALSLLIASEAITHAQVSREYSTACADKKVRHPGRLVVRVLCDLAGIKLPKQGGKIARALDPEIQRLERMRMNKKGIAS